MPDFSSKRTGNPITVEQWVTYYDNEGRLNKTEDELRELIYHSVCFIRRLFIDINLNI